MAKTVTLSKLDKDLWKIFSEYIRLRDADENGNCRCCTCGAWRHWRRIDAGHFISRGHKYLKFDVRNVHAQCKQCNAFKQGDYANYRTFMLDKYGADIVKEMEERKNWPCGFSKEGYVERIKIYKEAVKKLKRQKNVLE